MHRLFQRYPATAVQAVLWTVVYLLMLSQDGTIAGISAASSWTVITRLFGDVCAADLLSGQPWRFLTANFLHYSSLHLVINLVGLVQLGRMVEDWYGRGQTLLLCLLIGLLGNLASAGVKLLVLPIVPDDWRVVHSIVGQSIHQPSAGGSIIICGLVGLIGVVGWRSRTRFGNFVKGQMATVLLFTFGLGVALPVIAQDSPVMLDNLGHAGGALVGGLFGLLHKRMLRRAERKTTRVDGIVAVVAIVVCIAVQAATFGMARAEITTRIADSHRKRLELGRELLVRELQARERLGGIVVMLSRVHEQTARPLTVSDKSLLDRATARWAYRADIPTHQTLLPLRWQAEIEPMPPTVIDRRMILQSLGTLTTLDAPLRNGKTGPAYLDWFGLVSKGLYQRPTPAEYVRFLGDFRTLMDSLGAEVRQLRQQIEALGLPESLEWPRIGSAPSNPIGHADSEQAEPEP